MREKRGPRTGVQGTLAFTGRQAEEELIWKLRSDLKHRIIKAKEKVLEDVVKFTEARTLKCFF